MALGDYELCALCGCKVLYTADTPVGLEGDIKVLCQDCVDTHDLVVVPKVTPFKNSGMSEIEALHTVYKLAEENVLDVEDLESQEQQWAREEQQEALGIVYELLVAVRRMAKAPNEAAETAMGVMRKNGVFPVVCFTVQEIIDAVHEDMGDGAPIPSVGAIKAALSGPFPFPDYFGEVFEGLRRVLMMEAWEHNRAVGGEDEPTS